MLPSTGPICAPPSGDMVLLPGVPPLALMVPCRPPGRPHGLGRGLVLVLVLLAFGRLANTSLAAWRVLARSFRKLSEGARSKLSSCHFARIGSDHAPVARIVAAGTCADTFNLRRAIAGNRREPVLLT